MWISVDVFSRLLSLWLLDLKMQKKDKAYTHLNKMLIQGMISGKAPQETQWCAGQQLEYKENQKKQR